MGEEEEEEEEQGWNVEGEVVESEPEEESSPTAVEEQPPPQPEDQAPQTEEQALPIEEPALPVEEAVKDPSPENIPEPEQAAEQEQLAEQETVEEIAEPEVSPHEIEEPAVEYETQYDDGAFGEDLQIEEIEEEYEPYKRKEEEVEHPIILRRPKFYITDFQLRKKFYFVSKLIDVELLKGKTLRMQSISSSIGPVTCEW